MARGELRECERVLAGQELLLPRLDLLLPRRRERLHDAVDERANVRLSLRDPFRRDQDRVGSIWRCRRGSSGGAVVPQREDVLVLVRLALFNDRKLRHFRRRLCVSGVLNPCFSNSVSASRLVDMRMRSKGVE